MSDGRGSGAGSANAHLRATHRCVRADVVGQGLMQVPAAGTRRSCSGTAGGREGAAVGGPRPARVSHTCCRHRVQGRGVHATAAGGLQRCMWGLSAPWHVPLDTRLQQLPAPSLPGRQSQRVPPLGQRPQPVAPLAETGARREQLHRPPRPSPALEDGRPAQPWTPGPSAALKRCAGGTPALPRGGRALPGRHGGSPARLMRSGRAGGRGASECNSPCHAACAAASHRRDPLAAPAAGDAGRQQQQPQLLPRRPGPAQAYSAAGCSWCAPRSPAAGSPPPCHGAAAA